jgi:hypothetical protein
MPNRQLTNQDNFDTIEEWLDTNLNDENSFIPLSNQIPPIKLKGVYFWFMQSEGYKKLSRYIDLTAIKPRYTRAIDGKYCDLVYLGTAGVRNNKNGINYGNLEQRLKWHIQDNQTASAVSSGTMSTFRRTLIPLFSDDLLLNNSQTELNNILGKYFKVFYLPYSGSFLELNKVVDSDESLLVDQLRPIFNLSKNKNSKVTNHLTSNIQKRRILVERNTKKRLDSGETKIASKVKSDKLNKQTFMKPSSKESDATAPSNNCVEFKVQQNQNVVVVAESTNNLPKGKCSIEIWDSSNRNPVYPPVRNIRKIGRTVMDYFNAPDTANGNIAKWQKLQNIMVSGNIKEITVKVCSQNDVNDVEESNWENATEGEKSMIMKVADRYLKLKNKKIVHLIPCSGKKNKGGNNSSNVNLLFQNEILGNCRERLIAMYNANNPQNPLDWSKTMPAIERYNGKVWYSNDVKAAISNNPDKVLIVSALFGIIKPFDLIPYYDLEMKQVTNGTKVSKFWKSECDKCVLNKALIAHKNNFPDLEYVNLLTKNYQMAFCNFAEIQNIHPANNYVPNLINPTNRNNYDNHGYWIRKHLIENL